MADEPTVKLQLFMQPDGSDGYIQVSVYSQMMKGRRSDVKLRLSESNDESHMGKRAAAAAGALAEHLGTECGDSLDPSECAQMAAEAYAEMLAELKQRNMR